jgi:selenocysteine lyase/cysteine desulfurase
VRVAFGQRFEAPEGYPATASIGLPPAAVADAVEAEVRRWRAGAAQAVDFDQPVAVARAAFARLVGVPVDRVAVGPSASALIGLVAAALPDGARVLVARDEFTSVSFPFAAQAARGITVTEADVAELPARVGHPDLVAVSVAQSADSVLVDLVALREGAARAGTRVLLDATQAAGWLPLSLAWADAVVVAGYKWLMCPRGVAWMAVSRPLDDQLVPHAANWFAGADPWDSIYGLPLRLAPDARRLDTSPTWFSHVGAAAALPWLASLEAEAVRAHCVGLADRLRAELGPSAGRVGDHHGGPPGRRAAAHRGRAADQRPPRSGPAGLPPLQHRRRRGPGTARPALAVLPAQGVRCPARPAAGPGRGLTRGRGRPAPPGPSPAAQTSGRRAQRRR